MSSAPGSLGLELGIAPSSSAAAGGGDMWHWQPDMSRGAINFGSDGDGSMFSGLIRDFAIGLAVALAAKWAWGKMR